MLCIAISFLVMIIAVAVSSGFRKEIRKGVSAICGDMQITPPNLNVLDSSRPIEKDASYLPYILDLDEVTKAVPVIYRAGIIKQKDNIHGVLFKGVPEGYETVAPMVDADSMALAVAVPKRLSEISGLGVGDRMTSYFVGERVRLRQFNIVAVYEDVVAADDRLVIYASLGDLQRLDGWSDDQVSAIEIFLDEDCLKENNVTEITQQIGAMVNAYSSDSESPVVVSSSISKYPQLFDWLDLIDFNVLFILLLMTVVAGFNMISGLLIMLFENISKIGLLKALGMTDKAIAKVFLSNSAVLVFKGMLAGNFLACLFCVVQKATHLLKLDPANYFVSFVPVDINIGAILAADAVSFVGIMLLLLLPTMFISKVDPAQTIRMK